MAVLPELADSRLNHFLFLKFVATAAKISVMSVATTPTITPHQKSGIYIFSPPLIVGQHKQKRRSADHEQQERQRVATERRYDRCDCAKYRAENAEFIHSRSSLWLDRNEGKSLL